MKMAFTYFLMGSLFTFLAFVREGESIWEPLTIAFLLIAALDFFVAFKFTKTAMQRRHKK